MAYWAGATETIQVNSCIAILPVQHPIITAKALATTDWLGALTFYRELFGWEATDSFNDPAIGTYQMYGRNGRTLGGMFNKPAQTPGPPAWPIFCRTHF